MTDLIEMKRLYEQKRKSLREIGVLLGRDHHWVKRRLEKLGVTIKQNNKLPQQRICEVCRKAFKSRNSKQRFCSYSCRGKGKELGLFSRIDEHPIETRICPTCSSEFECRDYSRQKYCNRICFDISHSKRMSGKGNPSYIDGAWQERETYRGSNWARIRREIYKRDNYTCQHCEIKCISKSEATSETNHLIIQCHHISPYKSLEDNKSGNLITLCLSCHSKLHNGSQID